MISYIVLWFYFIFLDVYLNIKKKKERERVCDLEVRSEMVVFGWFCCFVLGFFEIGEVLGIYVVLGDFY